MTTMRVASELAAVLVPIGYAGAALAAICAIVAAIAIIRGAGGLTGGAVGVWIVCALMSVVASFAQVWTPLILSGAALVAMLVIGGVVRGIINAGGFGRREREVAEPLPQPAVAASKPAVAPKTPVTASVAVVR